MEYENLRQQFGGKRIEHEYSPQHPRLTRKPLAKVQSKELTDFECQLALFCLFKTNLNANDSRAIIPKFNDFLYLIDAYFC